MAEPKRGSSTAPSPIAVFLSTFQKYATFIGHWWWTLLPLIGIGIGVGYWKGSQKAPFYASYARMMVSGRIALPEGAVYSEELSNFFGTQIELMQSNEVRKRAAARVEASRPELRAIPTDLSIGQQRGTSFFTLSVRGSEPQYCQAFLEAVMTEYVQFKREMRSDSADTAVTSVTDQLLKLDKELQAGEEELVAFQKKDNVVFLEEEGNSAGRYLIGLRQKLADLQTESELLKLLDLDQTIDRQRRQQSKAEESMAAAGVDATKGPEADYLNGKQEIQILEAKRDRLGKFLRPKHPKMVALEAQIEQQHKLIELYRAQSIEQLQTRRAGIDLQMRNLEGEIKEWETKALNLNQKISDYNRLKAKVDRNKSLSDRLVQTVQSVDVNKNLGQDVLSIMEHASPAGVTQPKLTTDLVRGGAMGLLFGLSVLGLFAFLDDKIASVVEVHQAFDEEVIAQIPREGIDGDLDPVNAEMKHPMFAEACKNLRSSLVYMSFDDKRPKTILITSSIPEEGKSTISANFAVALASAGSRTLLVDGDLRKGRLHDFFEKSATPGLAEVLRGQVSVGDAVTTTTNELLFFLPRGRFAFDASELFLRPCTDTFLRQIYDDYDYIVIDSAPVLAREDTASLAPKIDATLFVIRAGVASIRRSRSALDTLHKRNANILGIVFNAASSTSPGYYYYESYGEEEAAKPSV